MGGPNSAVEIKHDGVRCVQHMYSFNPAVRDAPCHDLWMNVYSVDNTNMVYSCVGAFCQINVCFHVPLQPTADSCGRRTTSEGRVRWSYVRRADIF